MTHDKPSSWAKWLSLAEWRYNSTYHSSIRMTLFEGFYRHYPLMLLAIPSEGILVVSVKDFFKQRQQMTIILKENLEVAMNRMKQQAEKKKTKGNFKRETGVRPIVYKLELPVSSTVHIVFHVSLLKKRIGDKVVPLRQLLVFTEDEVVIAPQ
ncbi:uncharacterized protein LOC110606244 [Manihot esculenta]|uniref:uncharacterized protein LOC110606244 n=1 Tax=Manihot esculenta TaxID=3983 RepID=UPI000B5D3110|nr:uncharacterized protein LOC110606244 [Manihot esculenta]